MRLAIAIAIVLFGSTVFGQFNPNATPSARDTRAPTIGPPRDFAGSTAAGAIGKSRFVAIVKGKYWFRDSLGRDIAMSAKDVSEEDKKWVKKQIAITAREKLEREERERADRKREAEIAAMTRAHQLEQQRKAKMRKKK